MLIRRLTAVFGKLQGQTLELNDGLNIIQAPNETGKSTWCAFILAMFYGINSRERDKSGIPADKTRYAPWNGAAMSGRLDCRAENQELTLLRTTKRPTAPLGEFRAQYTDTSDEVLWLNATLCGEQLLGVTRDVYARSAFIRQNGLGISQSTELERRISSLISSGEENTSYTEAADALKKQLNQRRHNRTGQIPALESALSQLKNQSADAEALSNQILSLHQQEQILIQQECVLRQELESFAVQEDTRTKLLAEAKNTADYALRHADMLRQQLDADRIPENDTIARLRGAIVNLNASRHALEKAREVRDEALKELMLAETAVAKNPFSGQSAEQAKKFVSDVTASTAFSAKIAIPLTVGAAAIALGIACVPYFGQISYFGIPIGLLFIITPLLSRRKRKHNLKRILQKHSVSSAEALDSCADEYANLLAARDIARENSNRRSEYADTLYNSISSSEQAILLEIRRFAPAAYDLSTADSLLRGCAIRRKELATSEQAARDALLQQNTVAQKIQAESSQTNPITNNRANAASELARVTTALAACRKRIHQLTGQLAAIGDTSQLRADIEATEAQLESLRNEHSALQLALEALDTANQSMQNRFSPALGRQTARLFSQLTQGQYQSVILDRTFRLSAEPTGAHIYRDISLLSAGAIDQLYLAARLAICETVLPPDKNAPLILDDALANFDDERCASALQLLKKLSLHRQVLLFTCHSREAAFFADDSEVTIHQLTNSTKRV